MVCDRLHIICGNCGQDLKEPDMATWEYIPQEVDDETGDILYETNVFIHCKNCATVHSLNKYMKRDKDKE